MLKVINFVKRDLDDNFIYYKRFMYFLVLLTATSTYLMTNFMLPNAIDPKLCLDDYIPLIPFTIFIYHMWYPGIILLVYMMRFNEDFDELLRALAIGMVICNITYKLFPFLVSVRPEQLGNSFSEKILKLTYMMDEPTSSMPSSHVVLACIAYNFAKKHKFYSIATLNFLIPYITLTTKQHVIADVFVAIILSYIILFLLNQKHTKLNGGFNGIYYTN